MMTIEGWESRTGGFTKAEMQLMQNSSFIDCARWIAQLPPAMALRALAEVLFHEVAKPKEKTKLANLMEVAAVQKAWQKVTLTGYDDQRDMAYLMIISVCQAHLPSAERNLGIGFAQEFQNDMRLILEKMHMAAVWSKLGVALSQP